MAQYKIFSHLNQPFQLGQFDPPIREKTSHDTVRTLRALVQATACIQRSEQLFVIYGGAKKCCTLSKQHLYHWVVDAIAYAYSAAGLAVPSEIKCHSTRSVSISWAILRGVPLEDIGAMALWASLAHF